MDTAACNHEQPRRRVINNHDGGAAELVRPAPPDWGRLVRECIDVMADTHVDALFWGLGSGHTFQHDTRVGEFKGESRDTFDSVQFWRVRENSRREENTVHTPQTAQGKTSYAYMPTPTRKCCLINFPFW